MVIAYEAIVNNWSAIKRFLLLVFSAAFYFTGIILILPFEKLSFKDVLAICVIAEAIFFTLYWLEYFFFKVIKRFSAELRDEYREIDENCYYNNWLEESFMKNFSSVDKAFAFWSLLLLTGLFVFFISAAFLIVSVIVLVALLIGGLAVVCFKNYKYILGVISSLGYLALAIWIFSLFKSDASIGNFIWLSIVLIAAAAILYLFFEIGVMVFNDENSLERDRKFFDYFLNPWSLIFFWPIRVIIGIVSFLGICLVYMVVFILSLPDLLIRIKKYFLQKRRYKKLKN
jgi:hypothetical protein